MGETNYGGVCSKIVSQFEQFLGGSEADLGGGRTPKIFRASRDNLFRASRDTHVRALRDFLRGGGESCLRP